MASLEKDLAAYYDQEAPSRAAREIDARHVALREEFAVLLMAENRARVLEVGIGTGRDAAAFLGRC